MNQSVVAGIMALLAGGVLAGCTTSHLTTAKLQHTQSFKAKSGVKTGLGSFGSPAIDCGVGTGGRLKVLSGPSHGKLSMATGYIVVDDPNHPCNGMSVKVTGPVYRSSIGYVGPDRVKIANVSPPAPLQTITIDIEVVK